MKNQHLVLVSSALLGLTLGMFAWSALPARAAPKAVYTVTRFDDPVPSGCAPADCSLREAITAANSDPGSTVSLGAGTYTLSIAGAGENSNATGDLDIYANMRISGAGAATTIIQGGAGWSDRILDISAAFVQITDVTIRNGNVSGNNGGGIYVEGGTAATLTRSIITNNIASVSGGGIQNDGTLTLNNTNVVSNTAATGGGGGIFMLTGTYLTLNASTLMSNTAAGAQSGGGLWTRGIVTITNSTISGNSSGDGGGVLNGTGATMVITSSTVSGNITTNCCAGIENSSGAMTITNSSVINNTSGGDTGGVWNDSTLVVMNSTISGNSAASYVGGIQNQGTLTMTNSTISGNKANIDAGGLFHATMTATLNNVTIANNTADDDNNGTGLGGGVYVSSGTLNLANMLIGANIDKSGSAPDCNGTMTSQGYNLIGNTTGGCTISGSLTGVISNTNPFLGPLANVGGATKTHALLAGSPAINAGNPGASDGIGSHCMPTDQRGVGRPIAGQCDIGAFEGTGAALYLPLILR